MNAHRTGGSIVFRNEAGEFVGVVPMSTMPLLIACGEQVPVQGIDAHIGHAARVKDQAVVTLHGQTYHAPWHLFRNVGMLIGTSVTLTGPEMEAKSPALKPAPVLVNTPGQAKEYVVIPPKKMKPGPSPSPSYVRQSYRKIPVGGIA